MTEDELEAYARIAAYLGQDALKGMDNDVGPIFADNNDGPFLHHYFQSPFSEIYEALADLGILSYAVPYDPENDEGKDHPLVQACPVAQMYDRARMNIDHGPRFYELLVSFLELLFFYRGFKISAEGEFRPMAGLDNIFQALEGLGYCQRRNGIWIFVHNRIKPAMIDARQWPLDYDRVEEHPHHVDEEVWTEIKRLHRAGDTAAACWHFREATGSSLMEAGITIHNRFPPRQTLLGK